MKSFTGSGFDQNAHCGIRQNLGDGCGKENDVRDPVWMRDSHDKCTK